MVGDHESWRTVVNDRKILRIRFLSAVEFLLTTSMQQKPMDPSGVLCRSCIVKQPRK